MQINIGMTDAQRKAIADGLSKLLADSYSLYIKTHNYHWNVTGPQFNALHTMFEEQYTELATAIDEIAERIRALGHLAPGSYKEFSELTSIKDGNKTLSAEEMVKDLIEGQETVARTCRSIFPDVDEASDEPTADLLTVRMQTHEKTAWMLRAMISE
ncbi:Dps family protein [Suttonella ornithocola]|uniref:DNA protection during starvation protein 2 n=1 Tax=Suttonella ornithocola TaxID=279832 RepID=A0A380MPQ5_9GAMM|nr:Dps family protein [Suttonella ornithocola]SUO94268.1 DNA protection during starvation protein 2 [Suttonella ornithocola]